MVTGLSEVQTAEMMDLSHAGNVASEVDAWGQVHGSVKEMSGCFLPRRSKHNSSLKNVRVGPSLKMRLKCAPFPRHVKACMTICVSVQQYACVYI